MCKQGNHVCTTVNLAEDCNHPDSHWHLHCKWGAVRVVIATRLWVAADVHTNTCSRTDAADGAALTEVAAAEYSAADNDKPVCQHSASTVSSSGDGVLPIAAASVSACFQACAGIETMSNFLRRPRTMNSTVAY